MLEAGSDMAEPYKNGVHSAKKAHGLRTVNWNLIERSSDPFVHTEVDR